MYLRSTLSSGSPSLGRYLAVSGAVWQARKAAPAGDVLAWVWVVASVAVGAWWQWAT